MKNEKAMAKATSSELSTGDPKGKFIAALRFDDRLGTVLPVYAGGIEVGDYLVDEELRQSPALHSAFRHYAKAPRGRAWVVIAPFAVALASAMMFCLSIERIAPWAMRGYWAVGALVFGCGALLAFAAHGMELPDRANLGQERAQGIKSSYGLGFERLSPPGRRGRGLLWINEEHRELLNDIDDEETYDAQAQALLEKRR